MAKKPIKPKQKKAVKPTWETVAKNAYEIAVQINAEIGAHTHDEVIEIIDFINCRVMGKKCLLPTRSLHFKDRKPMELK